MAGNGWGGGGARNPNSLANLAPPFPKGKDNPAGKHNTRKKTLWNVMKTMMRRDCPEVLNALNEQDRAAITALCRFDGSSKKIDMRHILAAVGLLRAAQGDFKFWKEIMDRHSGSILQIVQGDITYRSELEALPDEELRRMHEELTTKWIELGGPDHSDRDTEGAVTP